MGQNNDITEAQAQTINYVGKDAYKLLYKYLKPRIEGLEEANRDIVSRLDVIESEAKNVIALTDEQLLTIIEDASSEVKEPVSINYLKNV